MKLLPMTDLPTEYNISVRSISRRSSSLILLLSFIFLFFGCSAGSSASSSFSQTGETVPPGHCRVRAEVLRIDSTLHGRSESDPCSKAPCVAWILVKEVIAHGSGTNQIGAGDTLQARFAFTLSPTSKNEFPTLRNQLPGLSVGSIFTADVQPTPPHLHAEHGSKLFMIYGYRKLKR
jgi:hypothetical protein